MQKYQYFNGVKFTRDEKTGYYLNSTIRKRMHRYVWEFYHGEIPKGCHIHHKDKDRSNNDISNLEMMSGGDHEALHVGELVRNKKEEMIANLHENARPKAVEWHKSEEGRQWHREQYQKTKDRFHADCEFTCEFCGSVFVSQKRSSTRFCSNKCRAAWRRKSGVDNETRVCPVCGAEFTTNKYSKVETCSRGCANKKRTLK